MTISSTSTRAELIGNGSATVLNLTFRFFDNADVAVYLVNIAADTFVKLTITTDYTITGAGEPEVDGSAVGKVTAITPPAVGYKLLAVLEAPLKQPTELINQGRFFPDVHETAFDRLCLQIQQIAEQVNRAVKVSITGAIDPDDLVNQLTQAVADAQAYAAAAAASASQSGASAAAAAASLDDFETRYLGGKTSDPALDNDGNPLQEGALYWNLFSNIMRVWTGGTWQDFGGGAGATGAGNDKVFMEADTIVTGNYIIGESEQKACTISIASPAVITQQNQFIAGQPVWFNTDGTLPTGLVAKTAYYVLATGLSASSFQVSATKGGAPVNTSGTQSGAHTCGALKNAVTPGTLEIIDGVTVEVPTGSTWTVV